MIFITDVLPGRVKSFFPPLFSTSSRSLIYSTERMFCLNMPIQLMAGHTKNCVPSISRWRDCKELMPTSEIPGSAQQRYREQ